MHSTSESWAWKLNDQQSISEKTFLLLRDAILKGKLVKGEKVNEKELAERIGVSRTPVREALKRLEQADLVVSIPRKYYTIVGLTVEDIIEIVTLRGLLEQQAIITAVPLLHHGDLSELEQYVRDGFIALEENNDKRLAEINGCFHDVFLRKNRKRLRGMVNNLQDYVAFFRAQSLESFPDRARQTVEEHEEILHAVKRRDAERAGLLVRQHIENGLSYICKSHAVNEGNGGELKSIIYDSDETHQR